MSIYGEDGSTGYAKEDLYHEIENFLENHSIGEMLKIVTDVVEINEYWAEKEQSQNPDIDKEGMNLRAIVRMLEDEDYSRKDIIKEIENLLRDRKG